MPRILPELTFDVNEPIRSRIVVEQVFDFFAAHC
jgi:hypothetical protein